MTTAIPGAGRRPPDKRAPRLRPCGSPRGTSWRRLLAVSFAILLILCVETVFAWPSGLPAGVIPEQVASVQDFVSDFVWLDQSRLIIVGKSGRLILYRNEKWAGVLLDYTGKVQPAAGDRGLMCIAVDPKFFSGRPYIYVGYTVDPNRNGGMNYNLISRFTYENDKLQDEVTIFGGDCKFDGSFNYNDNCSPMPGTTHSIGTLWFPGDGALWVSVGEGNIHDGGFWTGTFGYVGTDRALAMDPDFLGGKILRIDPDTGRGYPDNPWCDGNLNRARCKAWASGLRNPFRCAGGPGAVRCGDVGWYTIESYKMLYKGQNSGWPCYEGTTIPPGANGATQICQRIYNGDSPYGPVRTGVLYQWNHNGGSAAAIGGVQIPAFYPDVGGRWIVADYVSGNVWAMAGGDARTFFTNADGPASFRVGADGFLYYIRNPEGTLIRLRVEGHTPAPDPTIPKATTSRPRIPKTTRPADPLCNPTRRIVVPECTVNKGEDPLEPVQYLSREGWPQSRRRFVRNGLWSTVGLDTSVGNRTVNSGRTLSIAGTYYLTGFGTHAASIIEMSLNKCCYRFTGLVGVDDEVGRFYPWWRNASLATVGGGEFTVKDASPGRASDKVLWNSTRARPYMRIRYGTKAIPFNIKRLGGISKIRLEARVPARLAEIKYSDYTAAHLDWVEPKLYCGPRAPYAPIINLVTPPEGFIAKPGANVKFSATATYWDGTTPIPGGKMFWKWDVKLIHCQGYLCHEHQVGSYEGVRQGVFNAAPHDDSRAQYYYYLVQIRVTDKCGNYDIARRAVPMQGFLDMP